MRLAGVLKLMARSPVHRTWTVSDIERLVVPPLALGQCLLLEDGGRAVAFASYALLTEEAEAGYVSGTRKIRPGDWNAGDRLWLIDVIAPYGHAHEIVKSGRALLRERGFAGRELRFRRNYPGREGRRYARVKT